MSEEKLLTADTLIIGGGLVGLIAAKVLANCGLKVILIDQSPWPDSSWKPAHSKGLALNHASISFLNSLEISLEQAGENVSCIQQVHVSERGAFLPLLLSAKQAELPFLGYLIPEANLFSLFKHSVEQEENISILRPASIQAISRQTDHWHVQISSEQTLHHIYVDLLIAADGAESSLRDLVEIKALKNEQQQSALVAQILHTHSHQQTAYQRFTNEGTLAFLPEKDLLSSTLVISASPEKIARWKQYSQATMLYQLQHLFGFHLGKLQAIDHIRTYPLQPVIAEEQIKPGFLLLGNAAHFIHPVAAQGLNLSLQDIKTLQEVITTSTIKQHLLRDFNLLKRYDEITKARQKKVIDLTNTIINFFTSPHLSQGILRRIGLSALQISPTLKKKFTRFAAGY